MIWSKKFAFCIICGTAESEHDGKGVCKRCSMKKRYREKREEILKKSMEYRKCNKEKVHVINRRYYQKNKDVILAKNRVRWQARKEKYSLRSHQYWLENRERLSVYRKAWRLRNIDHVKANSKRYRQTLEFRLIKLVAEYKRRSNGGFLSAIIIKRVIERDGKICHYCGIKCELGTPRDRYNPTSLTIDHVIPISKAKQMGMKNPNVVENLVVACRACNIKKGVEVLLEKTKEFV